MPKYELVLPGGTLSAKSGHELLKKIEAEAEFWKIFEALNQNSLVSPGYYAPSWVPQAIDYVKSIRVFWPNHLELGKAVIVGGDDAFRHLKDTIESSAIKPPYSASRVGTLAKRLASKGKLLESVSLLAGASGQQFAQLGSIQNQAIDHASYIRIRTH